MSILSIALNACLHILIKNDNFLIYHIINLLYIPSYLFLDYPFLLIQIFVQFFVLLFSFPHNASYSNKIFQATVQNT